VWVQPASGWSPAASRPFLLGVSDQNKINDAIDAVGPGETVQMRRVEALQLQDDADSKKAIGYALVGYRRRSGCRLGADVLFRRLAT
jgi:hypothetical protein